MKNRNILYLLYLLLPLLFVAIIHGLMSFIMWDINPAKWDTGTRFMTAMFYGIGIVVGSVISYEIIRSNKSK